MSTVKRVALAGAIAILLAVTIGVLLIAPKQTPLSGGQVAGPAGAPLPESFVGVSVETTLVPSWFSRGCSSPVQQALEMLGRPEIRVGGNSQDRLWPWLPLPPGEHQVASAAYFHALHCLSTLRMPLLVGLNLIGRDPQSSSELLSGVLYVVNRQLVAISIGNEPNLYGTHLPTRSEYTEYLQLYFRSLQVLRARFGSHLPPIVGPDASTGRWIAQTAQFVAEDHPAQVDAHVYGLSACGTKPGTPGYPTTAQLLEPSASTDLIAALAPVVAAARRARIPAQISEANSVACGGIFGISNTPASALWALALIGSAAQEGFARVEFHSSGGAYDPFAITSGQLSFRPLWSAMLLADQLWPAGSRPLHLKGIMPDGISGWVARRPNGSLALILLNESGSAARRVTLRTVADHALLGRLLPDGNTAVTLDGRELVWSHGHATWHGRQRLERPAIDNGRLTVTLPPMSAAWLLLGTLPETQSDSAA